MYPGLHLQVSLLLPAFAKLFSHTYATAFKALLVAVYLKSNLEDKVYVAFSIFAYCGVGHCRSADCFSAS